MGIKVYTKDEVDNYLALLTQRIDTLTRVLNEGLSFGFNKVDAIQNLQASKRIIEQEAEIAGDVLKILDDCGDTSTITEWVESWDALNPVDNQVYVKQGSHSMALGIDADLDAHDAGHWLNSHDYNDLSEYKNSWIYIWVYFPTLDYLLAAGMCFQYIFGTDLGNQMAWDLEKSDLVVGWNVLKFDLSNPTTTTGVVNWANITVQRIYVVAIVGNTNDFTFYVDSIMFVNPF